MNSRPPIAPTAARTPASPAHSPARRAGALVDGGTLALLGLQWTLFIGNFVLYAAGPLPLVLHFLLGFSAVHLAFTIWHEAAHRNVSSRDWLNHAVGILGMLPYMTPYFLQRQIHLDHHRLLNEPGDPNAIYAGGPFWQLPLRYAKAIGVAREKLADDRRGRGMRISDLASVSLVAIIWIVALLQGFFVDLLLLWGLPFRAAKIVMDWYVSYLPHVGLPPARWLGTRIVDVAWLTPLVLAHNYHAIHHLWPSIPWHRYRRVYRERQNELRKRGVPIEHRVFGGRIFLDAASDPTRAPASPS